MGFESDQVTCDDPALCKHKVLARPRKPNRLVEDEMMATSLNPQEIYLLERFISPEYFAKLRDTWAELVRHVDTCFEFFMRNPPAGYRLRSLLEQPDGFW